MKKHINLLLVFFLLLTALSWAKADKKDPFLIEVKPAKVTPLKSEAFNWLEANKVELSEICHKIWGYAELAMEEYKSSELLASYLEKMGFTVTRGVAGMPTAFVAVYGSGQPVIGILAEYDALPGLSQDTVPYKKALKEGAPGHGCGHNVFGPASTAAAVALKEVMAKHKIPGTIKLFGCPAEETVVGKVF
ncbi:MAG: M20/M25/M40 family metallo-hydrolase, partial [Candidatus Aminicenantales bacterium]